MRLPLLAPRLLTHLAALSVGLWRGSPVTVLPRFKIAMSTASVCSFVSNAARVAGYQQAMLSSHLLTLLRTCGSRSRHGAMFPTGGWLFPGQNAGQADQHDSNSPAAYGSVVASRGRSIRAIFASVPSTGL